MTPSSERRGSLLADYNKVRWQGIEITTRPLGFRRLWPLKRFPYLTGSKPRFEVTVRALKKEAEGNRVEVAWYFQSPEELYLKTEQGEATAQNLSKPLRFTLDAPFLPMQAEYRYDADIFTYAASSGYDQISTEETLVTFGNMSSDSLRLWVSGILLSLLASICGGLLVGYMLRQDSPNPLIVTIATATPISTPTPTLTPSLTPASQSGTGNNAP